MMSIDTNDTIYIVSNVSYACYNTSMLYNLYIQL